MWLRELLSSNCRFHVLKYVCVTKYIFELAMLPVEL